jgi:ATP-binding cassette subfamily A (ABC1) protein 3
MVLQTIVLQLVAATIEWGITYYKKNQHDKTIARISGKVVSFIKSKIRRQAQVVEDDDNVTVQMEEMDTDCMAERKMIEMNDFGTRDVCLSVNGLQKSYGAGSATNKTRKTIDNMYIALDRSECFGLLGKNGAGKTSFISKCIFKLFTLLDTLTGFTPMDAGSVTINGISLAEAQKQKMLTLCPQHDTLFDQLSVEDHLLFLTRLKGLHSGFKEEYQHVKEIIEEVGLEEARRRMAKDLSGGMKRRLSIAMALTGSPQLVLLDEPTTYDIYLLLTEIVV